MSKKNKKKLRKILRAKINASQTTVQPGQTIATQTQEAGSAEENKSTKAIYNPDSNDHEAKEVKLEIRNIILSVALLVAIIVVLYLINIKSDIILKAGEWLSSRLNINV